MHYQVVPRVEARPRWLQNTEHVAWSRGRREDQARPGFSVRSSVQHRHRNLWRFSSLSTDLVADPARMIDAEPAR